MALSKQNYRINIPAVNLLSALLIFLPFISAHFFPVFAQDQFIKADEKNAVELKPEQPIKRQIASAQTHLYKITLSPGQFINITAQTDQWLSLTLRSSNGQTLIKVEDTPTDWNSVRLPYIAVSGGEYYIEAKLNDDYVAGNYTIEIKELRTAAVEDEKLTRADNEFRSAYELDENQKFEDSKKAVELYSQALSLYEQLNDRAAQAKTLYKLGWIYRDVNGEMTKSLEYFNQSLDFSRAIGDRKGEFQLLNFIGATYSYQGEYQKAIDYKNKALIISREIKYAAGEGYNLHELGFVYGKLGEFQKALDYYESAMKIWRQIGNQRDAARTLVNVGNIYAQLGDPAKAIEFLKQALAIEQKDNDRSGVPAIYYSIGTIYEQTGERQKALDYYHLALKTAREAGAFSKEAVALMNIGAVESDLGQTENARADLNKALTIFRALESRADEAQTLEILGISYAGQNENDQAAAFYAQSLDISRAIKDRVRESETLYLSARLRLRQNNLSDALEQINSSIKLVELLRGELIGDSLRTSYLATVENYYKLRTAILMRLDQAKPNENYDALAFESAENARARSLLDLLNESKIDVRQGVDANLLEREKLLRRTLSEKSVYQMRLLGGKHSTEQEAAINDEIKKISGEYEQTQAEIRAKSPRYAALTQPQTVSLKDLQSKILDENTLLLEYSLGDERSFLWVAGNDSLKSYELAKRADIESAARKVYDILTARNRNPNDETADQKRARIEKSETAFAAASADLSRLILAPAAGELKNKRLVIVADGALQYVPFAALPIQNSADKKSNSKITDRFLIETNEIVYLPSASTLTILRDEKKPAVSVNSIAVVADPVFSPNDLRVSGFGKTIKTTAPNLNSTVAIRSQNKFAETVAIERAARESGLENFSRLRFSRDEAEGIAAIAPRRSIVEAVDFAASKQTVLSENFGRHRIIHFATHGLIDSQSPALSGVVLSLVDENGDERDGFLRLFEIYNLKLESDLVVLSACRTALGKDVRGEGLIGLTRGFMYAGAPRVVASLWSIDDRATAELMKKFYAKMLRENARPAAALRAAQVEMLKNPRFSSPYFWAAFTLEGEWR